MRRATFLKLAGGAIAALATGKLPQPGPEPVAMAFVDGGTLELGVLRSSGGLCAPLTPIYDIPTELRNYRPVREALLGFTAPRSIDVS